MAWSRRDQREFDLERELRGHLELEADDRRASGLSAEEAARAARRALGNTLKIKEDVRAAWGFQWLEACGQDLRYAIRQLRRTPAFTTVAVTTLALGIGATSAIFSVVNAVLLRPLPYRDASQLAMLWSEDSAHGLVEGRVSLANAADWKQRSRAFADMTFFAPQTFLLGSTAGPPERMREARVSANFFSVLGVEPVLGRSFTDAEEQRAEPVAVISYGLWTSHFGQNANILGQDIIKDGRTSRIIGVMPAAFHYPFDDTVVWEPRTTHPYWTTRDRAAGRTGSAWLAVGRIRPATTWNDAQTEMSAIAHALQREFPQNLPDIHVVPLQQLTTGPVQLPLFALFGSVVCLLLIACSNVANLLLARGTAREAEFSLRRALGASRGRLARQLLTESLVLAIVGAVAGLAVAAVGVKGMIAYGPQDIPRLAETRINSEVLLFTVLVTVLVAAASGLWPALPSRFVLTVRRRWGTAIRRNVASVLAIGEVSIALVLLASAGLMLRSFVQLTSVNPGFLPEHLLILRIDLHVGRTPAQQVAYFKDAIERSEAVQGVRSAGAISGFLRSDPEDSVTIEGRAPVQPGPSYDYIEGAYLTTAGIPLKQGRLFTDQDGPDGMRVAIINETMARTYWPDGPAVGRRFRFADRPRDTWITVVGVAGDMHRQGLGKRVTPQVFLPNAQGPENMMDVLVRTASDPRVIAATVHDAIQTMDKTVPRFPVSTAEQQLRDETASQRFQTSLIGLFSLVALFLSIIGVYGLMHYFVQQRTNDIGVRMALGAGYGNVLALVMRRGVTLVLVGIAVGAAGALEITKLFSSLLYGISANDPVTFVGASLVLLAATAVACWIPARRATRIDPLIALKYE
jgi:putative ABC transport system permease protein